MDPVAVGLAEVLLSLKESPLHPDDSSLSSIESNIHNTSCEETSRCSTNQAPTNYRPHTLSPHKKVPIHIVRNLDENSHFLKKMKVEGNQECGVGTASHYSDAGVTTLSKIIIDTSPDAFDPPNEMKTFSPSCVSALHSPPFSPQSQQAAGAGCKIARGNYRCGRCGQLKSNHVCDGVEKQIMVCGAGVQSDVRQDIQRFLPCAPQRVFAVLETVYGKERVLTVGGGRKN